MENCNKIGFVGQVIECPRMILDADNEKNKIFETKIKIPRKSENNDILIIQYEIDAFVTKENPEKRLEKGMHVMIAGEIRTENEVEYIETRPRVKIFVRAEVILNAPAAAEMQNDVRLSGKICRTPNARTTQRGMYITDIMVKVKGKNGSNYIPCVCWGDVAQAAATFRKGMYVEIEGRMNSRSYKKKLEEDRFYLMTAYEVSVTKLGYEAFVEE